MHYENALQGGVFESATCSVTGCTRPVYSQLRALCCRCNSRWQRHGDPTVVKSAVRGDKHPMWLGNNCSYIAAHSRVKYLWGSATQYECVSCGGTAAQWAYDGTDPTQMLGQGYNARRKNSAPHFYSAYPEFYMPMCRKCHTRRDVIRRVAELTEYREWKHRTGKSLFDSEGVG